MHVRGTFAYIFIGDCSLVISLFFFFFSYDARFILSLENDLTVRAKTTEITVGDFSSGSYATIFGDEVICSILFIHGKLKSYIYIYIYIYKQLDP